MEQAERFDCELISHDRSNHPVAAVFLVPQSVAVLDPGIPPGDCAFPRPDDIGDTNILSEDLASPTIVIAGDPEYFNAGVSQLCEGGERAEAATGNHGLPLEPEVEKISVDHERGRLSREPAQKTHERPLDLRARDAEMRIGNDVARRLEHGTS